MCMSPVRIYICFRRSRGSRGTYPPHTGTYLLHTSEVYICFICSPGRSIYLVHKSIYLVHRGIYLVHRRIYLLHRGIYLVHRGICLLHTSEVYIFYIELYICSIEVYICYIRQGYIFATYVVLSEIYI